MAVVDGAAVGGTEMGMTVLGGTEMAAKGGITVGGTMIDATEVAMITSNGSPRISQEGGVLVEDGNGLKKLFWDCSKCFGSLESEADILNNTVETSSAEGSPGPKEVTSEQIHAVLEDLGPSSSLASEDNSSATSFSSDASLSSLQLREDNALHIELKERRYAIGKKLNEGDFVSIFKAIRTQDGTRVALKVSNKADTKYYRMEGHSEPVPLEVRLLTLANVKPRIPQVVELLDWHQDTDQYTMELIHLLSLKITGEDHGGPATAWSLWVIMFAMLCGRIPGVQDLKELDQNVWCQDGFSKAMYSSNQCCQLLCSLLQRDPRKRLHMLKVCSHNWFKALYYEQEEPKIIAAHMSDGKKVALKFADRSDIDYISVVSTREFIPPEFKEHWEYFGKPATVWSLGILMFCLVTGEFPSTRDLERLDDSSWTYHSSSAECCKLLCSLLQRDPERRCELEDISGHPWFNSGIIPTGI
ncbi:hypothetical protein DNTS_009778 [Danionella cerebrum]|uniref:non-specific serine/threonine protein kinase n=1 Tax=Danionella cerebrum TaxID=2873325 RepID=A0A553N055_9TELE|nr:hypothetical protein DNTS_009778 [Danionella translucida]